MSVAEDATSRALDDASGQARADLAIVEVEPGATALERITLTACDEGARRAIPARPQ